MKNLWLIPETHQQQEIVKASLAYDKKLIAIINAQKGVHWSPMLRSRYLPTKECRCGAFIDYSQLKKQASHSPRICMEIIAYASKKSLANNYCPLDHIIEQKSIDNVHNKKING